MKNQPKTNVKKVEESKFKTKSIRGIRHMICQNSVPGGKYWKNVICETWEPVGTEAVSVLCHNCINSMVEPPKERLIVEKSDKPKGWKFMKEFVDADGNVYHKGVEQPGLFGTLHPTVIEPKPEKKKLSKKEKEVMVADLGKEITELKAKLFVETRKGERAKITSELSKKNRQLKKLV